MTNRIRIGTRGSRLAMWQAERVKELLLENGLVGGDMELVAIRTSGDKTQHAIGFPDPTPGVFVKEIEKALLEKKVDVAVHSLKDLPSKVTDSFALAAFLKRDDPRDVVCVPNEQSKVAIEQAVNNVSEKNSCSFVLGTSSPRRVALVGHWFDGARVEPLRGNIETRLSKMEKNKLDGVLLAAAGISRLGLQPMMVPLPLEKFIPSAGQGVIGVECLSQREDLQRLLAPLNHKPTEREVAAERQFTLQLGATCHTPVGAFARTVNGGLVLSAILFSLDGKQTIQGEERGTPENAVEVGNILAGRFFSMGAKKILKESL